MIRSRAHLAPKLQPGCADMTGLKISCRKLGRKGEDEKTSQVLFFKAVNLFVHPFPDDVQTEDGSDWWRQVGRYRLDVDVQLASLHRLDDRNPRYAHGNL